MNSYRDITPNSVPYSYSTDTQLSRGFKTIYHSKEGGRRFVELLDKVSMVRNNICSAGSKGLLEL